MFHVPTLAKFLLGESTQSPTVGPRNDGVVIERPVVKKCYPLETFKHYATTAFIIAVRFALRHWLVSVSELRAEVPAFVEQVEAVVLDDKGAVCKCV